MTAQAHHFVLVPLMAQGHMIPMMDAAHVLAERGAHVSVITAPVNAARIKDATVRLNLTISLVELQFPCTEVGLPDGCENLHLVPSVHLFGNFFHATELLAPQLESFLRNHQVTPTCIITDLCHPWTKEIADKLRIPRLIFNLAGCFFLLCSHIIHAKKLESNITDDMELFNIPDLPVQIRVSLDQALGFGGPGAKLEATLSAVATADGVLMNSFEELEPWVFEMYRVATGKKAWGIGPLSLCKKDVATMATRGSNPALDAGVCLTWLDNMKQRSVVFVCFGSTVNHSRQQLIAIGVGLEASGQPFILVIKEEDSSSPEMVLWLNGFIQRTEHRSLVIKGWAPQAAILSHEAIGGFVTHCGWNSIVEGISKGLPMITWPHFADQFLNERLIVEILGIGVAIGVTVPITHAGREVIEWSRVERAIKTLMDEGRDGKERRQKARDYGEKAKRAMEKGGSSYENSTDIFDFVWQLRMKNVDGKVVQ